MPSLKHTHEYVRVAQKSDDKREIRYRCQNPDCTHYIQRSLVINKRTICSLCHVQETIMDYENARRANPVCFKCCKSKRSAAIREKSELFEDLFGGPAMRREDNL